MSLLSRKPTPIESKSEPAEPTLAAQRAPLIARLRELEGTASRRARQRDEGIAIAEARLAEAQRAVEQAHAVDATPFADQQELATLRAELKASASPLAAALTARLRVEDAALWPPAEVCFERWQGLATGREQRMSEAQRLRVEHELTVSNAAWVRARQTALRELVSQIERWSERGSYLDDAALTRMFSEQYQALPAVPALADIMRTVDDPRGRAWLSRHAPRAAQAA